MKNEPQHQTFEIVYDEILKKYRLNIWEEKNGSKRSLLGESPADLAVILSETNITMKRGDLITTAFPSLEYLTDSPGTDINSVSHDALMRFSKCYKAIQDSQ